MAQEQEDKFPSLRVKWYNSRLWFYDLLVIKFNLRFACMATVLFLAILFHIISHLRLNH